MATQPQPAQSSPTLVTIRFPADLLVCIREVLALRSMTLQNYVTELIESDTAPLRLKKWQSNFLTPSGPKAKRIEDTSDHRSKLTGEQERSCTLLHEVEGVPVSALAKRFNCAKSTIERILQRHDQDRSDKP